MKDRRVRYRPEEQRAIVDAQVACFCLHRSKGLSGSDMADILVTALPAIVNYVQEHPRRGYIVGISREAGLRRLFPRT